MLLYTCASAVLGFSSMPYLAQVSLHKRGISFASSLFWRLVALFLCALGAICAWVLIDSTLACLAFTFGASCMAALLICDMRAHILPTGPVALFACCALVFRFALEGIAGLLYIGMPALLIALLFMLLNYVRRRRKVAEVLGAGDIRMIVPLALFSGASGIAYGIFTCALVMGLIALIMLISRKATRHSHIALAPGLCVWFFAGTLIPLF